MKGFVFRLLPNTPVQGREGRGYTKAERVVYPGAFLFHPLACSQVADLTACLCAPVSKFHPKSGSRATEDASLSCPTAGPGINRHTESLLNDRAVTDSGVKGAGGSFV